MKRLLVMGGVTAFILVWVFSAAQQNLAFALIGLVVGAIMLVMFWRNLNAVETPPESLTRLSEKLGVRLETTWGMGADIRGGLSQQYGFQRRAKGLYKGLQLTYADDTESSRVTLHHARPLGLGLFCTFNLPRLSELSASRPLFSRKVAADLPWMTCRAAERERAERLLRNPAVRSALIQRWEARRTPPSSWTTGPSPSSPISPTLRKACSRRCTA